MQHSILVLSLHCERRTALLPFAYQWMIKSNYFDVVLTFLFLHLFFVCFLDTSFCLLHVLNSIDDSLRCDPIRHIVHPITYYISHVVLQKQEGRR